QMCLEIDDGLKTFLPDCLGIQQCRWEIFVAQDLRMHSDDKYFFVVRPVENSNPAAFWKAPCRSPQEVVIQFLGAGVFETENLTSLRIDTGHHMPDGAVFPCGIHGLKNQQNRILVTRIELAL